MDFDYIKNLSSITVKPVSDFSLQKTLECGQCFRATKGRDGRFIIVAMNKVIELEQNGDSIVFYNSTVEDIQQIWLNYFDFYSDYGSIYKKIMTFDKMKDIVDFSYGIHVLRQDLLEMITSFVLSCRNSISGVSKTINLLCENYGNPLEYNGVKYFTFPEVNVLRQLSVSELEKLKFGYRAKYLYEVYNNYDDDYCLGNITREVLLSFPGVGNKVADCVMLHSGISKAVFPVDIWISRGLRTLYGCTSSDYAKQSKIGTEMFGELSGYAEILLFYYARENKLGV
ncbi:MAG: 8-oxoguanine DNA glycosylase [Oscillospiraceae bacterium]|nr:8-oxoguanine DNA glycosylase [Oscillospiraceae bacterium]MCL2277945.1 8-oxoguanine DNA glycosylase [Oscillospiraceae bacterium]